MYASNISGKVGKPSEIQLLSHHEYAAIKVMKRGNKNRVFIKYTTYILYTIYNIIYTILVIRFNSVFV